MSGCFPRAAVAALLVLCTACAAFAQSSPVVQKLQDISVTIRAGNSQGSGIIFTRPCGESGTASFVWTAGHVVDGLRKTREVVDTVSGTKKTIVEFQDAKIVTEFKQDGRKIGEATLDAQVIRYSDAENGEDLALLRIRKSNFVPVETSAAFYLEKDIPAIGTELYHVGSLLGQVGANSLTSGVMSQVGRVLELRPGGVVFDQTTVTAFPGSSGGGVYLQSDGRCVGMLVRGAGEGFNFIVPVRRISAWAEGAGVMFAVDPAAPMPSEEELKALPIDDAAAGFKTDK